MEEAAQPQQAQPRRFPAWPLLFCVLPVLLAMGLFWLINRQPQTPQAENQPAASADLGSRASPLAPTANESAPSQEHSTPPANVGENTPPTEQPKEAPPSEREIDIHIKNLKFAVQHNNAKGRELESKWLREARPREAVIARLTVARDAENDALVRLAYFWCVTERAPEEAWAESCYAKWRARFLGTDTLLDPGQIDEFSAYARCLFGQAAWSAMALELARNALQTAGPPWVLEALVSADAGNYPDGEKRADEVFEDLTRLLESEKISGGLRDSLLLAWACHFDSAEALLLAAHSERLQYAVAIVLGSVFEKEFLSPDDISKLMKRAEEFLLGKAGVEFKRRFIEALSMAFGFAQEAEARRIIEAGLQRHDANAADYLAALGRMARSEADLKRIAEYANDANADVARGAINGLRQSSLKSADDELRTILATGKNSGVKGDALAALLERNPQSRELLVDEYLGEDKPVALRVIAVSYLSNKRVDKLKELGENDRELRVREAAINKLGALKDKSLKTWFVRVSRSDPAPVLRQLAKKFAAELE